MSKINIMNDFTISEDKICLLLTNTINYLCTFSTILLPCPYIHCKNVSICVVTFVTLDYYPCIFKIHSDFVSDCKVAFNSSGTYPPPPTCLPKEQ